MRVQVTWFLVASISLTVTVAGCSSEKSTEPVAVVPAIAVPPDGALAETLQSNDVESTSPAAPANAATSEFGEEVVIQSPNLSGPEPDTLSTATPAGSALTTIFSPSRAPKRKTMGLLQRSFLDLADQGDQELEVALVIDGTDSMATELAGVRQSIHQMLEDLRRYRSNEVRASIVVYRDAGSPSGEVVLPLKQFTDDAETIARAVEALQPESGAPFFHELPDLGLHAALTELPWSQDDRVAKWILMFGDAPPYEEAFRDPKMPDARRRYATPLLVSIAKKKNIRINCVLCTSGDNVVEPYDKVLASTRSFMNSLAGGTDGLMLDLSYPEIRTALIDAGKQPDVALAKIEPITAVDLAAVRRENVDQSNAQNVRLAVIPHLPLTEMTFDARNPAVQVSTALRTKLSQVPGVRVASPRDIKEQLRRLRSTGLEDSQAIRGLAARLGVDYVVWGSLAPDQGTVQTAAYRRDDGQQIVPVSLAMHSDDIAYVLIQASAKGAPNDLALSQMMSHVESLRSSINAPMAEDTATHSELLVALEALEQALAYESGSQESVELLETADRASQNAAKAERRNSLAHWLQANVAYNQAMHLFRTGDTGAATARMRDVRSSLRQALEHRDRLKTPSLVTEIEADYYSIVKHDAAKAAEGYAAMTKPDQPIKSQLRGHWSLAGLYAGDWGYAEDSIVNPEEARRHVTEILANWPDSPEATLFKQWLRWNEESKKTEFNFLPTINIDLSEV